MSFSSPEKHNQGLRKLFDCCGEKVCTLSDPPADVLAGAAAPHAAAFPPAPDPAGGGRPPAALLPPLDPAVLQTGVPRHRGYAHVGGLLGALPGQGKVRAAACTSF